MYNFDPYNVLLSISTNIPQRPFSRIFEGDQNLIKSCPKPKTIPVFVSGQL